MKFAYFQSQLFQAEIQLVAKEQDPMHQALTNCSSNEIQIEEFLQLKIY